MMSLCHNVVFTITTSLYLKRNRKVKYDGIEDEGVKIQFMQH